ncbi:MAG: hypothetical protein LDL41_08765 [Coleofasciculus sp. S288]|nr:hypothetical protein [Coleofasciculus sp. S288]
MGRDAGSQTRCGQKAYSASVLVVVKGSFISSGVALLARSFHLRVLPHFIFSDRYLGVNSPNYCY